MMLVENRLCRLAWILVACLFPTAILAQSPLRYQESAGIVIMEIESAENNGSWELETSEVGHTGDGYLHYRGENFYNTPGNSLLTFEIAIEKTGKYRFQWHSRIALGESNTEHNDSWLRFKDASDFYGEKNGQRVYPKGVGKTPNPNGTSVDGWLKIYQNNLNNWTWVTRTSDHDPHEIFVEFDTVGIYTIEISGRSNGHAINRLALFHSDANTSFALDLTQPESERIQTVAVEEISFKTLKIRPTVANDVIYLDLPPSLNAGDYEGQIVNVLGQQMHSFSLPINRKNEVAIPVFQLGRGIYLVRFRKDAFYYQGKFIKQ